VKVFKNKKVVVVMPAYNTTKTLLKTHPEVMDQGFGEYGLYC